MIEWIDSAQKPAIQHGRLFCLGGNYGAHQKEMGLALVEPSVFVKVDGSLVAGEAPIRYPEKTEDFHFEGEFVLLLGSIQAQSVPTWNNVIGITAGLDLTRRDIQAAARTQGNPWETAKSFPGSARLAPFVLTDRIDQPERCRLITTVNGKVRQTAALSEMILSPDEILAYLHAWMPLRDGDLVFTGTPAGVGPLAVGDVVQVQIEGLTERTWGVEK